MKYQMDLTAYGVLAVTHKFHKEAGAKPPVKPERPAEVRDFLNALEANGISIEDQERRIKDRIKNGSLPIFAVNNEGLVKRLSRRDINSFAGSEIFLLGVYGEHPKGKINMLEMDPVVIREEEYLALADPRQLREKPDHQQERPPPKPKKRRKRNKRYDWSDIFSKFDEMIGEEGIPGPDIQGWQTHADVHRTIIEWYTERYGDDAAPDEDYLAKRLAPKWRELES